MNTQMERVTGHTAAAATGYGEVDTHDHRNVALQHSGEGHDHEGEHHEKKSVLKKVKAKAKKIKDTIKGHVGHGHDDHDEDEYDDDEMDTDPDVHGVPVTHGITTGKEGISRQHGTNVGERTAIGGHVPITNTDSYQVFDPTTTHYVPGQEETLGWSRTDTGTPLGAGDQTRKLRHTPVIGGTHSTGDLEVHRKPKLGGILEKDHQGPKNVGDVHPANYQANVSGLTSSGYGAGVVQDFGLGQGGGTERRHGGNFGERSATEGASHIPVSKPVEYQTFDTPTSKYVPGQEENLGWSRTDTGRSKLSEPYAPKNTPITAHTGGHYDAGVLGTGHIGESAELREILDRPSALEKDPHAPRVVGERRQPENYQSKVTDPTGRGGEEMGVPSVLHQLGKMNIHDESSQNTDSNVQTGQQEQLFRPSLGQHEQMSTGSHNQFSAEPVTRETSAFLQPPESRPQFDEEEQKPGSYTEKITSVASELANKAKTATGSVTSKLGYGGSSETPANASTMPLDQRPVKGPLDNKPVPGGYGETLSSVSTAVADTAAHAKDVVASKLGYGGTHEARPAHDEEQSKAGSIGDYGKKVVSSVQEKIAPVYDKVAGLGSTVASKVQGSVPERTPLSSTTVPTTTPHTGREYDVGSAAVPDKGVSVKDYLAEKLKPGEEDKALSKVITEALPLHKQKENPTDSRQGYEKMKLEIKSQLGESEQEKVVVIKGRVTESEEVANRLGRGEETDYDGVGPGLASPGKSVMDRIRDAAGTWFNKSGEALAESGPHTEGGEGTDRNQSGTVFRQDESVRGA